MILSRPAATAPPHQTPPAARRRPFPKSVAFPPRPKISASRLVFVAAAAAASAVELDSRDALERCFLVSGDCGGPSCSSPVMKGGKYGAFGGVTLEKSKLDVPQPTAKMSPELAEGGGGGDIGRKNFHGGDGGDDDGDDDNYFDDFDEGDEGDDGGFFRRRLKLQELFDKNFLDAVLQEWCKTMQSLPSGLRQAYAMGLVSSAQLLRFLSMDTRPSTARAISRFLPERLSRAFVGRMIADPSFFNKLALNLLATFGCSLCWEVKTRKERIRKEWGQALISVLTVMAFNSYAFASLAPSFFDTSQKLPNNIFEKSYRMREFDVQKRVYSFFYKAAELSLLGGVVGSIQGLPKALSAKMEGRFSVITHALCSGAFLGLNANIQYQLLCGFDRSMFSHFEVLGVPFILSIAMRTLNVWLGEESRHALLGADQLVQSDNLLNANRQSDAIDKPSPNSFISKNAVISGLGLFGIKQGNDDMESAPAKALRKRIIRKKSASSA